MRRHGWEGELCAFTFERKGGEKTGVKKGENTV